MSTQSLKNISTKTNGSTIIFPFNLEAETIAQCPTQLMVDG